MDYGAVFASALTYKEFLDRYASSSDRSRWDRQKELVTLTKEQLSRIAEFPRDMKVICMAGAWCGDCVDQCPLLQTIAETSERVELRFLDRDDAGEFAERFQVCGAARVPAVVFLSEDNFFCGQYGDRTLARYRDMVGALSGAACSSGIAVDGDPLTAAVLDEWVGQFERIQHMLRTSGRLRRLHND